MQGFEPVWCFLGVLKIAAFEGSGFLGLYIWNPLKAFVSVGMVGISEDVSASHPQN